MIFHLEIKIVQGSNVFPQLIVLAKYEHYHFDHQQSFRCTAVS